MVEVLLGVIGLVLVFVMFLAYPVRGRRRSWRQLVERMLGKVVPDLSSKSAPPPDDAQDEAPAGAGADASPEGYFSDDAEETAPPEEDDDDESAPRDRKPKASRAAPVAAAAAPPKKPVKRRAAIGAPPRDKLAGGDPSAIRPLRDIPRMEEPPEEAAPPEDTEDYEVQRIFFGTDREISGEAETGPEFGHVRANKLTLGRTEITIPRDAHRVGHMERPRTIKVIGITLWKEKEDPAKHFTVHETCLLSVSEFTNLAGVAAGQATNYKHSAFVFLHGFNTTFAEAMFRAAQMAHDLGFDGPAFAYSWPSVGNVADYVTDMDSADNAVACLDEFLEIVLSTPGVRKMHLVAHSMGNAALAELVTRIGTRLRARSGKPIDQLILASPDIDAGEFVNIARHFTDLANGVTLYACANDRALLASMKIRSNYVRAGDVPDTGPVIVAGVDTIDVTAVGTEIFSLNHNVYAKNRGVLDDLGQIFLTGMRPPKKRMPTLQEIVTNLGSYWKMPK